MPARSAAQQRLMGMALAAKRGKGHFSKKIQGIADSMTEQQLHDFAKTKHDGLPSKKAEELFLAGFVKRAASLGYNPTDALGLLKRSNIRPALNTAGEILLGHNYNPFPLEGESALDARINRDRNIEARNLALNSIIKNPLLSLAGQNAAKASDNLHTGLHGANVMGNFGRISDPTFEEKNDAMKAMVDNYYKHEPSEADGNAKTSSEQLHGGAGDYARDSEFPKKELAKGVAHESEHTDNRSIAKEIAKDHLKERKDYYTRLAKAKIE